MLLRLIFKDLRAFHKFIVTMIVLPGMAWAILLIYPQFYSFSYISFSSIATICMTAYFIFYEKKGPNEALICSLPVTRTAIVSSRYLLASLLSVTGILIFWGTAFLCHLFYTNANTRFEDINNVQTLGIAVFFIVISLSLFLPVTWRFRLFGMISAFALTLTIGLYLQFRIIVPEISSFQTSLQDTHWVKLMILTGLIILSPLGSYQLSKFFFNNKDI